MAKKQTYEELEQRVKKLEKEAVERKRAEEELKYQKRRLDALIEYSSLAIVTLNEGHNIISCNRDFEKLFHFKESEIVGINLDELIAGQKYIKDATSYTKETLKGKAIHGSGKRKRKDGIYIDVQLTGVPVIIDGKVIGAYGIYQDISERKQAEESLRESEERYRTIIERSPVGLFIIQDRKFQLINPQFLKLTGYSEDDFLGADSLAFVLPEDRDMVNENIIKMLKEEFSLPFEFRVINKSGEIRWVELTVTSIQYQKRRAVLGYYVDINESKQAREEIAKRQKYLESVVNSAPDAIVTLDASHNIIEWNPGAERIFGYTRDEVVGKDIDDLISHPDMKHELKALTKQVLSREKILSHETVRYKKDGTPVNVIVSGSPILIEGELHGVVAVYTDITEVKKLETQLRQSQKMETIGILAGGVAHDLNNILSGIISYPELLLLDLPEDSTLRKPLLTIKGSGEKAAVVVQDLLTLARRGVTITEIVNLNSIISEQLKSPEYEKLKSFHPDVDIETNLEKDLLNIKGSTAHLSKTVMNLISNAAEAMPDGGKVLVSTENLYIDRPIKGYDHVTEGDYVVVTVIDTGIGISKEDIERIFEPFYTKKVMGRSGSGLGMSVVWGTVKDHNGYIDVKSIKGKGTTFTLYFPVTRKELAIDKSLLSIEDYMGKGESILIVDDVGEQREIASVMLKKLGYSVTSVSSGEEAIEYMKDNSADLLVLDMIMDPGIDGLDTYKKILELHPKQKAIITSGFSETDRVKKTKKLGAGAYVKKPYVLEKIGVVIKEELDK